jgi:GDP-L-fucose synthase
MEKDSKIVVFGASGLVGSAIVTKLIEKGYKNILGTYFRNSPVSNHIFPITYHQVNLLDQKDTENFFNQHHPQYIFLAAAKVGGILANDTYKAEFIYDNMAIALNVIHAAYKYGAKKLLNLGSSCTHHKFNSISLTTSHRKITKSCHRI